MPRSQEPSTSCAAARKGTGAHGGSAARSHPLQATPTKAGRPAGLVISLPYLRIRAAQREAYKHGQAQPSWGSWLDVYLTVLAPLPAPVGGILGEDLSQAVRANQGALLPLTGCRSSCMYVGGLARSPKCTCIISSCRPHVHPSTRCGSGLGLGWGQHSRGGSAADSSDRGPAGVVIPGPRGYLVHVPSLPSAILSKLSSLLCCMPHSSQYFSGTCTARRIMIPAYSM